MATTMERSKKGVRVARPAKQVDESTYAGRFAARLKALRVEAGLTVEELSAKLAKKGHKAGVATIYGWEAGRTSPPMNALPDIARVLRLEGVGELFPLK